MRISASHPLPPVMVLGDHPTIVVDRVPTRSWKMSTIGNSSCFSNSNSSKPRFGSMHYIHYCNLRGTNKQKESIESIRCDSNHIQTSSRVYTRRKENTVQYALCVQVHGKIL
mmetsp:Transcript_27997/g.80924  ORF Transcript_27997/g.80924 Transcript_27997/m.80924 type:complete len:112 (+) Transcript_27997:1773-2108(+)